MRTQTSQKAELFARALRMVFLGVFAVCVLTITLLVAAPSSTSAATNTTVNFQARLETSAGAVAADGNYNVEFKLYNASSSSGSSQGSCTGDANCLWVETRTGANQVHVSNGYLTVSLGSVTPFPSTINWNQQLWVTMNIGGTGGSPSWDGEMSPRLQLTAVPYAFQAGTLSATSGSNIGSLAFGTISGTDTITLPDASGTVCLQSSSSCGFATGTGTAFLQGGNSFGAQAVLGTNDGNSLAFRTNSGNRLVLDTSGNLQFQQASTLSIASAATGTQLTIQGGAATSGTNVGGTLLLQGGAGASTGASGSVIVKANTNDSTTAFQVQSAGGVGVLTTDTQNQTITIRAGSDHRTLGSELYAGNFSSGWTTTGWNVSGTTTAVHNTGNTSSLINTSIAITAGSTYQVSFDLTGSCASSTSETLTVLIGGTSLATINGPDCDASTLTYVGTATNTNGLTFTPTSQWPTTVENISIKMLSGTISPALAVQNTSGIADIELRANATTSNTYVGLKTGSNDTGGSYNTALGAHAAESNTSGSSNTGLGAYALQLTTTGIENTAVGAYALQGNTTGQQNTAVGVSTLGNNTGGWYNVAVGADALESNTTGLFNAGVGYLALSSNTTGSSNYGFGYETLGSNGTGSNNVAIGYRAICTASGGSNQIAIGSNAGCSDTNNHFSMLNNLQNAAAIGAYAQVQASNSIVLGSVDTATKVGIGITVPSNTFSVSPLDYQTGTVTRTNGSATLAGTSTAWVTAGVTAGDIIVFADGTTNTISSISSDTSLTMGTTYTGTTDASPVYYRFHKPGFQVTSAGNAYIQNTSATAFQVQNASGSNVLTVDTTNKKVTVGGNLVVNAASGFSGNLVDLQLNATSEFTVNQSGNVTTIAGQSTVGAVGAAATVAEGSISATVQNNTYTAFTYTTPSTGFYSFGCWWRQGNTGADTIVVNYTDGATSSARQSIIGAIGNGTIAAMNGANNNPNLINTCINASVYALTGTTITLTFKDPGATPSDQFYAYLQRVY